jgi:hypothetical protein
LGKASKTATNNTKLSQSIQSMVEFVQVGAASSKPAVEAPADVHDDHHTAASALLGGDHHQQLEQVLSFVATSPAGAVMQKMPTPPAASLLEIEGIASPANTQTDKAAPADSHTEFTKSVLSLVQANATASSNKTSPSMKKAKEDFLFEYEFWRSTLGFMSQYHGVESAAYDLAACYKTLTTAGKMYAYVSEQNWELMMQRWQDVSACVLEMP